MSGWLGAGGWLLAAALALEIRRRAGLVADAAHELRGPLTAIALGLEALRRQPSARRRVEALETELRRIEAGADDVDCAAHGRRARPRPAPVRVRELVENVAEAWSAPATRLGSRVRVDWRAGRGSAHADPRRLAQALGNLLSNAVEHGGGDIAVTGTRTGESVLIEIADSGVAQERARMRTRRGRGRGLGIAERALRQAGGTLDSRERPGGGRVAVAELPFDGSR